VDGTIREGEVELGVPLTSFAQDSPSFFFMYWSYVFCFSLERGARNKVQTAA